jgi:hypothetical protein
MELGVDVDQAEHDGATPVFVAAQNRRLGVIRSVANDVGSDVNQANQYIAKPVFVAAQNGCGTMPGN